MGAFHVAFSAGLLRLDGKSILPAEALRRLDEVPGITYGFLKQGGPQLTADQIQCVNGFGYGGAERIDAAAFSRGADDLTVICVAGVGFDKVDLAACTAAGVAVANLRGTTKHMVASGALTLILALSKRLLDKRRLVHQGRWDMIFEVPGNEIQGKVLGIVGLGDIGRELVRLVNPFEMRVIAYDPYVEPHLAGALGVELVDLDSLMAQADIVSIHCNLTPETRGLIGARELRLMKPTAYLVNLARGPVLDHRALTQALVEKWIAGAGVDVFEVEPLPTDDPLTQLDNAILTPHSIGFSREYLLATGHALVGKLLQVARGEVPQHVVNPEVLESSIFRRKLERFRPTPAASTTTL